MPETATPIINLESKIEKTFLVRRSKTHLGPISSSFFLNQKFQQLEMAGCGSTSRSIDDAYFLLDVPFSDCESFPREVFECELRSISANEKLKITDEILMHSIPTIDLETAEGRLHARKILSAFVDYLEIHFDATHPRANPMMLVGYFKTIQKGIITLEKGYHNYYGHTVESHRPDNKPFFTEKVQFLKILS